jgi:histidinol-phosphate aminotransferase
MNTPPPRAGLPLVAYGRAAATPSIQHWLDGNEGPASLAQAYASYTAEPEDLRRYPDELPLRRALAARFGLTPEQVAVGAGADELLDRLCRGYLEPGRRLLTPTPCFVMLPRYVQLAGAELDSLPWHQGPLPVAELQRRAATASVIALTSPNNPTGLWANTAELLAVARSAPHALVIADLAYAEFGEEDPTPALLQLPNVVVVRTFSKGYGLAGLRVGYALGPASVAHTIRVCGSPYPCAGASLALAERALARGPDRAAIAAVLTARQQVQQLLAESGVTTLPSAANFVFATFASRAAAQAFANHMAAHGIAVRSFGQAEPPLDCGVRVSVPGEPGAIEALLAALAALPEEN